MKVQGVAALVLTFGEARLGELEMPPTLAQVERTYQHAVAVLNESELLWTAHSKQWEPLNKELDASESLAGQFLWVGTRVVLLDPVLQLSSPSAQMRHDCSFRQQCAA